MYFCIETIFFIFIFKVTRLFCRVLVLYEEKKVLNLLHIQIPLLLNLHLNQHKNCIPNFSGIHITCTAGFLNEAHFCAVCRLFRCFVLYCFTIHSCCLIQPHVQNMFE